MHLGYNRYLILTKEARLYNGAKTASSINGAGKAGLLLLPLSLSVVSDSLRPHGL